MKIAGSLALTAALVACWPAAHAQFGTFHGMGMGIQQAANERQRLSLRPWVNASGNYWRNLNLGNGSVSNPSENLDAFGGAMTWGVSGGESRPRMAYGGAYLGSVRYQADGTGFVGLSNIGMAGLFRQLNREFSVSVSAQGGSSAGSFGPTSGFGGLALFGFNGFGFLSPISPGGIGGFTDPTLEGGVQDELFDNRVLFGGARAALVYSPNPRWNIGGGFIGSTAYRTTPGLADMKSAGAFGQVSYLIDPRTNFTGGYTYANFTLPGFIQDNQIHSTAAGFNRQLGRKTLASVALGVDYYTFRGATQIQLDPELAEILGTTSSIEVVSTSRTSLGVGARISHTVGDRISILGFYARGVAPTNGVLLSATRDAAGMTITYAGGTRWGLFGGFTAARSNPILQDTNAFLNAQGSGGFSYRIFRTLHATFNAGYRYIRLPNLDNRSQAFANIGIAWAPGEAPLRGF